MGLKCGTDIPMGLFLQDALLSRCRLAVLKQAPPELGIVLPELRYRAISVSATCRATRFRLQGLAQQPMRAVEII